MTLAQTRFHVSVINEQMQYNESGTICNFNELKKILYLSDR